MPGRIVVAVIRIRHAKAAERLLLEGLQRRSSHVWKAYRGKLEANPDAIELPQTFVDSGWIRVAVADDDTLIGDAIIVLRGNGPKTTVYGVHCTTAAVMLGTAALLLSGPE